MKFFKKLLSATLAASMLVSGIHFGTATVYAAPSLSAGWYETLYAEWADADPDAPGVKVGYKLSTDSDYTYLEGDDLKYLVRKASADGYGRVDIPGIKAGRYDIEITGSDGTVHTRSGIQVLKHDRSGYAHWNYDNKGVGAYNNDGTPKDNALIVYVTDENKDTVEIPGYEGHAPVAYHSEAFSKDFTRDTAGVGNILNNNHKYIREVTNDGGHPIIFRFIGRVTPPQNLTPYNTKTAELGGSQGDNGNLAITKYAKNITIEGIGDDATIDGWGFTFSQTSTCPADAGESFEVRNLTFKNYPEDALGFQGDDPVESPIRRVWVHNNVFYPGYCANPAESDKAEGDGSLDFKRGQYYTMSYNHYVNCHKTNLLGAGDSNNQFYMTLHHNWYQNVESRQPLASGGNVHIYNTYFQDEMTGGKKGVDHWSSKVIDLRGHAACFSEANYFDSVKNAYYSRKSTANIKTYNDVLVYKDNKPIEGSITGTKTVAATRDQSGMPDNGLTFPNGDKLTDWDTNPKHFYYDSAAKASDVEVLTPAEDVPEYVTTYAGTLKEFPLTESGTIVITVKSGDEFIKDASVTTGGIKFTNNGDGTYTAVAQLGSEYIITASKEGYSNQKVTSDVLQNDGDVFTATLDLPVDYDGYAALSITGGSDNKPVTGASVKLTDGTVLEEKGNGLYQSAAQLAVGEYTAVIENTGDYIAPASQVSVKVKTTDEPTALHLDKKQGAVSVTLSAAAGETEPLATTRATVSVGSTPLTNSGSNVFKGNVEINTPFDVSVNVPGWEVDTIEPASVTASQGSTANVNVTLKFKGLAYTWNYTDGTNTADFFSLSATSNWSSASKNPQTFDGMELTAAIKVDSKFAATFDAPTDGTLTLIMEGSGSIKINDTVYDVKTGENVFPVTAGENVVTRNKTETHLYLMQYVGTPEEVGPVYDVLSDEVMWDVTADIEGEANGLTFGEKMRTNSEENPPREFFEDDKTYELNDWIQGANDPKSANGINPANDGYIPVTGAFVKYTPAANGDFTVAAKTNAGKTTYIIGDGEVITQKGDETTATSYDVFRFKVKAGKDYYIYSGGSKICIYYLGFTPDGTEPDPVDETLLGDVNCDGEIKADDSAILLQYVLNPQVVDISEQGLKNAKVNKKDSPDASAAAAILQKVLLSTFTFETEDDTEV